MMMPIWFFTIREREQMVTRSMKLMGKRNSFIVLSCVAEPCGNSKEADGGKKLVSRAEESPDLGKSPMPREMPRITVMMVANTDLP